MTSIYLNGKQHTIPTSWNEVTLGNYEKWYGQTPQTPEQYINYIADICNIEAETLTNAPANDFDALASHLTFLSQTDFAPSQRLTINHTDYFATLSDKITLGEWIDIDTIFGDEQNLNKLSSLLAIVCRPAGEDYNHEKGEQRATLFRNQSCEKMLPLISFFLHRGKNLNETLNHYSAVVEAGNQLLRDTKTFAASGGGIKRLPIWQRIRYYFLIRSLEKQLSKYSAFSSIG